MPNTCRTDTFMSGRPTASGVTTVIDPPWPRNGRDPTSIRGMRRGNRGELSRIAPRVRTHRAALWHKPAISAKTYGFQVFIGLDDVAQPILGGAVAAIGVRVMALHQCLEADLDFDRRGLGLKPKGLECL